MINIEETQYACDKESTVHVIGKKSGQEIIREQMIILAKWNVDARNAAGLFDTEIVEQIRQNSETILKLASITEAFDELQKL